MKKTFLRRASGLFALLVFSLSIFAYTTDIAGKYTGSADLDGLGALNIKAEIILKENKFSGSINSDMGSVSIIDGSFADNKLKLTLDAGGDSAEMVGTLGEDGKIKGSISGAFSGTFQMEREKANR